MPHIKRIETVSKRCYTKHHGRNKLRTRYEMRSEGTDLKRTKIYHKESSNRCNLRKNLAS